MDSIMCHEHGCKNIVDPNTMTYGVDYYVLMNMTGSAESVTSEEILEEGLVGIFCRDCGIVVMAETWANGYEVTSRREE